MTTCDLCGRVTMGHAADEMPGEVCAERDGFSCVRRQLRRERTARETAERERDRLKAEVDALKEGGIDLAIRHGDTAIMGRLDAADRDRIARDRDAALAERDRLRVRVAELEKNR